MTSKRHIYCLKICVFCYIKAWYSVFNDTLKHFGLKELEWKEFKKDFDVIVTMDDVERRKPAPDAILKACRILKVKPKNTILIGDTKNDMIAGRKAGCVIVGYKVKGDYEINTLDKINNFI